MTVAQHVVTGVLAALLAYSAYLKLSGRPAVVESYARVGVQPSRLPLLATVLFVGAAGLLGGLVWTPLGVAAATAVACYFVLALIAHAAHDDMAHAATPTVLLLLATASAVLFVIDP